MPYSLRFPSIVDLTPDQQAIIYDPDSVYISAGFIHEARMVILWKFVETLHREASVLLLVKSELLVKVFKQLLKGQVDSIEDSILTIENFVANPLQVSCLCVLDFESLKQSDIEVFDLYAEKISLIRSERQNLYSREQWRTNYNEYELHGNYRGLKEITRFVKGICPHLAIRTSDDGLNGQKPRVIDCIDPEKEKSILKELIQDKFSTENLLILLPSKWMIRLFGEVISDFRVSFSTDESFEVLQNIHIGTFGEIVDYLGFDTVIIPRFDVFHAMAKDKRTEWYLNLIGLTRRNLFLLCQTIPLELAKQPNLYNPITV